MDAYSNQTLSTWNACFRTASSNDSQSNTTPEASIIEGLPSDGIDHSVLVFREVVHALDLYVVPTISITGIIGNTVCFLVFMTTNLKKLSRSVYLVALALSDTVFLCVTFISWANNIGWDLYHRPGWCQILVYLAYVSSFLSVWYVVGFTVERYLAVRFPFQRQRLCTTKRAKIVVIVLAVLASVIYAYALWTSKVVEMYGMPFCFVESGYYHTVATVTNVDTIITLLIPTMMILSCNIQIVCTLAKFYLTSNRITTVESTLCESSGNDSSSRLINCPLNNLQMKVTKMLLLVSSVFLVCNIPNHAMRMYAFILTLKDPNYKSPHRFHLVLKLTRFLFYTHFAVNLFLYSLSGRTFRKATMMLFYGIKQKTTNMIQANYSLLRTRRSRACTTRTDIPLRSRVVV